MRRSERVEGTVAALAVSAMMLSVPVAATVGTAVYSAEVVTIRAERSTRHVVDAVAIDEPRSTLGGRRTATVRWNEQTRAYTATVPVNRLVSRGDQFDLWIGSDGLPTEAPREPGAAATVGVIAGVFVVAATIAGGCCAVEVTRAWYRRRNARNWEHEWIGLDGSARG